MHIDTLMGGIYELCRRDGLMCYDIHAKFHKDWFRYSKVDMGGYIDTQTAGDSISVLLFF
jgi:hypothetical protein